MSRWLKEAALARIEPGDAPAEPGAPPWRAAVAAAAPVLAVSAKHAARVRFVVSDHFMRYLALPWDRGLRNEAELAAYLRHHFESVYGPRAADWRFAVDREGEETTRIAVAVDRALLEALGEAAAGAALSLEAIEPFAVSVFNRLRRALPEPGCFLVVREPGRLTSLLVDKSGAPRRVASQRGTGATRRELAELLAAEAVEAGMARDSAFAVCVADWERGARLPVLAWRAELCEVLSQSAAPAQGAHA